MPKSVTIDYYETGHTYQASDTVHANITKQIKKNPNIYDNNQFLEVIKKSRNNILVENVKYTDICKFKDDSKQIQKFSFLDLESVMFKKGFLTVFAKSDFEDNYTEFDILNNKIKKLIETSNQIFLHYIKLINNVNPLEYLRENLMIFKICFI